MIIDQYAGSPELGMEYRPFFIADELIRRGGSVTVIAGSYSHLRKKNPECRGALTITNIKSVPYWFLKTPPYGKNGADRLKNTLCFVLALFRLRGVISRELRPDAVIASSTHPLDIPAAMAIAAMSNAALIFELHDIWPLSLIELHGFSPKNPLMRAFDIFERAAIEKSDAVISLLPGLGRYCDERRISFKKLGYLPNAFSPENHLELPAKHASAILAARRRFGHVVMYAGGMERANAVEDFIGLSAFFPEACFVCVGSGREKEQLIKRAGENVIFLPPVRRFELLPLLGMADVLWVGMRDISVYRYGIAMNKLYDYMASGAAVVISTPCPDNPISYAKCGITVPASDKLQTKEAIGRLLAMPRAFRTAIGKRGALCANGRFGYAALAQRYHAFLEETVGEKRKKAQGPDGGNTARRSAFAAL